MTDLAISEPGESFDVVADVTEWSAVPGHSASFQGSIGRDERTVTMSANQGRISIEFTVDSAYPRKAVPLAKHLLELAERKP